MTQNVQAVLGPRAAATEGLVRPRRPDRGIVAWCAAAVVLLAASGGYRIVQAGRFADETDHQALCPFPLRDIPRSIDTWKVVEGSETLLDPQTTRITGSTDHIMRVYADELTGVALSVLILYGPAGPVTPHTPQVCYPSSGFATVGGTVDRKVPLDGGGSADFRSSVFAKSGGRAMIYQTVYHTYEMNGVWSPAVENHKLPRRNPGVFKVQIQRRSFEGERRGDNEPIEAFVAKLLPVIDRMTAEAGNKATANQDRVGATRAD
jgi:hypothetical protein